MPDAEISIALNRFGLGARGDETLPRSPKRWLLEQFERYDPHPPQLDGLPDSGQAMATWSQYRKDRRNSPARPGQPVEDGRPPGKAMSEAEIGRDQIDHLYREAVIARMTLGAQTDTPFVERLVQFWTNHFAISTGKGPMIVLAGPFEAEAIRPHVLGRFEDMLLAVEHHPAMLTYLDQIVSIGPGSPMGRRRGARGAKVSGLNENLGREILELHTLGVRSGYSQSDVTEFSKALTGWMLADGDIGQRGAWPGFAFNAAAHEPGARTILDKLYTQGGHEQAAAVLRDLARNPATARHIAGKLARAVIADDPPPTLVARLEQAYLSSDGDLPAVYRALIAAPESWDPAQRKFRTPYEWTIASMRALEGQAFRPPAAIGILSQIGQPFWRPGSPAGYDVTTASWLAPDALYRRIEAAARIAAQAGGIDARALARKLYPGTLTQNTERVLADAESGAEGVALLLASPEAMWR
jgi:uncharacterized protein (DUF1800 family)